jgi:hypothetical protein
VGQHVVDQMSYHLQAFLRRLAPHPAAHDLAADAGGPGTAAASPSLQQMLDHVAAQRLSSEVQVRQDLSPRSPTQVPITDFFAAPVGWPHAAGQRLAAPASSRAAEALLRLGAEQQLLRTAQARAAEALPGMVQQLSGPLAPVLQAAGRLLPDRAYAATGARVGGLEGGAPATLVAAVWTVIVILALVLSKA